jgi:ATP-dependent exoDNAse (exonuclease V) beta subunit
MACGSVEELEEERRPLYVACTRARTILEVFMAVALPPQPSPPDRCPQLVPAFRFLTTELRRLMREETTAGADATEASPDRAPMHGVATTEVDRLLDELWA